MKILLVHQNFPGQFKHLAPALMSDPSHQVIAFGMHANPVPAGLRMVRYHAARGSSKNIHPWLNDLEAKTIRGEAAYRAAMQLKAEGFEPDAILAHPGWGESLFLKEVWPQAHLGIYCEFFYPTTGGDVGFDPEFYRPEIGDPCRLRMKNANNFLHFDIADAGISPTEWQASSFPQPFRSRISVIHDGIDTDRLIPDPKASVGIAKKALMKSGDEVITFVNRNLEPYRGYHVFMRALPELLRRRPKARVVIVGGNETSYGAAPTEGSSWRNIFLDEVKQDLDLTRVHFVGKLPYDQFVALLQVSAVHVYLTYPFVLSWSLLEAMSLGCAVVASDTQPLHEAIEQGETGRLVPFFDRAALVDEVCSLLEDPTERARLGANARAFARKTYDLRTVCLPRQMDWVARLAQGELA